MEFKWKSEKYDHNYGNILKLKKWNALSNIKLNAFLKNEKKFEIWEEKNEEKLFLSNIIICGQNIK